MPGSLTHTYWATFGYAAFVAILAIKSRRWLGAAASDAGSAMAMRSALRRAVPIVFLLSSGAVLLFGRYLFLRYDQTLNSDESLFAAAAMLSNHGWLDWNLADTTSSGPLNAVILTWPYLLHGDITLFSARVTGLACTFGALAFLFLSVRRLSDDCAAMIAIAPSAIFFSATTSADFVHYSSEVLPNALLALSIYLFVCSFQLKGLRYLIGSGFVLGLVPFAKLQAAPMAAVVGVFVVARAAASGWKADIRPTVWLRIVSVIAAASAPALILLIPLVMAGGLDDFWKSYVVERRLLIGLHPWRNPLPALLGEAPYFRANLEAHAAMWAVAAVFLAAFGRRARVYERVTPSVLWTSALALFLVPVAVTSVVASGLPYVHYLLLLVPALIAVVGVAFAALALRTDQGTSTRSVLVEGLGFGVALLIVLPAAYFEQRDSLVSRVSAEYLQGYLLNAPHNLAWLRPKQGDHMVCWGWTPQCYVDAAIPPATRDLTNEYQFYETALTPYFRSRFLEDFARTRPDFIIDFVAPGNFGYQLPEFRRGIGGFPEFARVISADFELVTRVEPPNRCPRLYIRRARRVELDRSLIKFASVTATAAVVDHPAAALDDGSIFETCDDNWLLPDGMLGAAMIQFKDTGQLREVAILNTRRDSTDRIRLSVRLAGRTVAASEFALARFPRWTHHYLDAPIVADGLTIEILSYRGIRAGLNEVKAYRD